MGASEEAVPSQITNWGCWSRQADGARDTQDCWSCQRHLASLETGALNLAELRTQEETLPDAFDDAQGNAVVTSRQGS